MRSLVVMAAATLATGGVAAAVAPGEPAGDAPGFSAGSPLFDAANLRPGEARTACTRVAGSGRAALYAPRVAGDLAQHLRLSVRSGASCADAADRVYDGRLSDFPGSAGDALLTPAGRAYRFTLVVDDDPGAAGRSASWDWQLATERIATARSAASGCEVVALAGPGAGRTRTLTRTVRVSPKVRAVLRLRTAAPGGAPRVTATTGLRVRDGRTLRIPRWAEVRYRLNGELTAPVRRRPFRTTLAATAFHPGPNRISVAVRRRRGGPKRLAAFTVRVTPATIAGRSVCVVGA